MTLPDSRKKSRASRRGETTCGWEGEVHHIMWRSSVFLLVLGIGAGAGADERKYTRSIRAYSGSETMIENPAAWNGDCTPRPVTVKITQPPANGTISLRDGSKPIPADPLFGSSSRCTGRLVPDKEIIYRSNPGFQGVDFAAYEVTFPVGGNRASVTVSIEVVAVTGVGAPQGNVPAAAPPVPSPQGNVPAAPQASIAAGNIGALAVGTCDRLGYATGYADSAAAGADALKACQSNGDQTCRVVLSLNGDCAAFAEAGSCGPRGWANGANRQEAEQRAIAGCASHGGQGCSVRRSICHGQD